MPSRNIADLDPRLQVIAKEFLARCKAENVPIIIACTYRSNAEQAIELKAGRSKLGPGKSKHNVVDATGKPAARAFDIAIPTGRGIELNWDMRSREWLRASAIGEALGLEWGGRWKKPFDAPHFQLKD